MVNRFYVFMLVALSLILGFLNYKVLKPFLVPLAWAGVLSIVFYPIYAYILKRLRQWKSIASAVTLTIILLTILGPISYVSLLLASEVKEVADYIERGEIYNLMSVLEEPKVKWLMQKIKSLLNVQEEDIQRLVAENISLMGKQALKKISSGVGNVVSAFIDFVFMALSIFFLMRDGPGFIKRARNYMPFSEEQKDRFELQVKDMVVSVVYGGVVVAAVQGVIGGTAFYFLGLKSPAIWGVAIFIMSFIPMLGTFAIWGPVMVYFFIEGAVAKGFILLLIGTFGISMVDNILKPIIIGGRTKMPTLLIFFSVLGGIKLFGPIGIITGPLVVALFISVLEIFRNIETGGSNA